MRNLVISCRNIEDEVTCALQRSGSHAAVFWMDGGLHYRPELLRESIQAELDVIGVYDHVLIAMGYCGSTMVGLESADSPLVIPRTDDCIALLLGSNQRKLDTEQNGGTYFMTRGWLHCSHNICHEYLRTVEKYGQTSADQVFATIVGRYQSLALVDTDCYPVEEALSAAEAIAMTLHLAPRTVSGSIDYIERLLAGPWNDEDFLVVPRHTRITDAMLNADLDATTWT